MKPTSLPSIDLIINEHFQKFLGLTTTNLQRNTSYKISLTQCPSVIHIHCNLLDSMKVLQDSSYSQVLDYIPTKTLNETIHHVPIPNYIPVNQKHINNIRLWVTDVENEPIEEGLYPMHLTLKII